MPVWPDMGHTLEEEFAGYCRVEVQEERRLPGRGFKWPEQVTMNPLVRFGTQL